MSSSEAIKSACLMLGSVHHANTEFEELRGLTVVKQVTSGSRRTFLSDSKSGVYDNVVVISRTYDSAEITGPFDRELVESLPSSVKFICHNGAGYDQIDVDACSARGIAVSNTPYAVDDATANTALFLILGALRCAWIPQKAIRSGAWRGASPLGRDPDGLKLGILGMGGIGTATAKRAQAFGFDVQYHNRQPIKGLEQAFGTLIPRYVDFETLLATSDVISIHLPLSPTTRHLIGRSEIDKMKDGVILVNTARGAIIDEDSLVSGLNSGKISSVGLDVYENEPTVHPGLLANSRAVLLPHVGTATYDTQRKMEVLVIDNVISAIENNLLLTQVAEQGQKLP